MNREREEGDERLLRWHKGQGKETREGGGMEENREQEGENRGCGSGRRKREEERGGREGGIEENWEVEEGIERL